MAGDNLQSPPVAECVKCGATSFCTKVDGLYTCFWGCPVRQCTATSHGDKCVKREFHNGGHFFASDMRWYSEVEEING